MARESKINCQKPLKLQLFVHLVYLVLLSYSNLNSCFKQCLEAQQKTICRKKILIKNRSLTSGKGYFSSHGSTSVKGTVILLGRTTNPTTTSYITLKIMSLKKRIGKLEKLTSPLIQISLISKCLLYYN